MPVAIFSAPAADVLRICVNCVEYLSDKYGWPILASTAAQVCSLHKRLRANEVHHQGIVVPRLDTDCQNMNREPDRTSTIYDMDMTQGAVACLTRLLSTSQGND